MDGLVVVLPLRVAVIIRCEIRLATRVLDLGTEGEGSDGRCHRWSVHC